MIIYGKGLKKLLVINVNFIQNMEDTLDEDLR